MPTPMSLLEALYADRRAPPLWRFPDEAASSEEHTTNPLFEEMGPVPVSARQGPQALPGLALWRHGLIHPKSRFKRRWDALMRLLVIYSILIIPWNVGYTFDLMESVCRSATPLDNCFPLFMGKLDTLVAVLFWLDVGISTRTGLLTAHGTPIVDWRHTFDEAARSWLLYDLFSITPWDALSVALYASRGGLQANALILKAAKVPRLLRVRLLSPLLRAASAAPLGRLAKLLCGFLILAHWGACGMWALSRWQVEHTAACGVNTETGLMPMALVDHRRGVTYSAALNTQQAAGSEWTMYCADLRTNYMTMAYYALTTVVTVGYGDVTPGTNMERLGAIALELVGCVAYAVVFGNMAVLLQTFDHGGQLLAARLAALRRLCAHYKVPFGMAQRAAAHISQLWLFNRGLDMHYVMGALPESLHADVMTHVRGQCIETCPLLQDCPAAMMRELTQCLQPQACSAGDDVMRCGATTHPAALVFIIHGSVSIASVGDVSTAAAMVVVTEGGFIGAPGLFDADFMQRFSVRARTACQVHVLSRAAFTHIVARFPEAAAVLLKRAADAKHSLLEMTRNTCDADTDEGVFDQLTAAAVLGSEPDPSIAQKLCALHAAATRRSRILCARVDGAALAYQRLDERLAAAIGRVQTLDGKQVTVE